jgi:hypothetical protein
MPLLNESVDADATLKPYHDEWAPNFKKQKRKQSREPEQLNFFGSSES